MKEEGKRCEYQMKEKREGIAFIDDEYI